MFMIDDEIRSLSIRHFLSPVWKQRPVRFLLLSTTKNKSCSHRRVTYFLDDGYSWVTNWWLILRRRCEICLGDSFILLSATGMVKVRSCQHPTFFRLRTHSIFFFPLNCVSPLSNLEPLLKTIYNVKFSLDYLSRSIIMDFGSKYVYKYEHSSDESVSDNDEEAIPSIQHDGFSRVMM